MENIALIGIDLGKNSFHIHCQDCPGKAVYRKKFTRAKLYELLATQYGNYRDFAAATGLVPRQYSTEGRTAQQGISKWGNKSLRALQVQCAHVYSEDAGAPDRQAYRQYWCCKNGSDHRFLSMNSSAAVAPGIPWPFIRNGVFSSESS